MWYLSHLLKLKGAFSSMRQQACWLASLMFVPKLSEVKSEEVFSQLFKVCGSEYFITEKHYFQRVRFQCPEQKLVKSVE